jgi:thiol-disulfide isomerase/thioredoxin
MNVRHLLVVGLLVLAGVVRGDTNEPPRNEAMDQLLRQIGERQAQVQTLRQEAQWEFVMEHDGEIRTNTSPTHLVWERPGRLAARGAQFADLFSDGKTLTLYVDHRHRYMQWPITNVFTETLAEGDVSLTNHLHSLLRSLIFNESRGALPGGAWDLLPDEQRDGKTCWVVRQSPRADRPRAYISTLYIDQEYGLLWQQEMAAPPAENEGDEKPRFRQLSMRYFTVSRVINGPVEESDFAFEPDEDSKRVDTTARLFGRDFGAENGMDRFALSGQPAPGFSLETLTGETFELSAQSGKVVVIDFWATWCGPCVKALPHMRELHERYAASNVVFVGISRDREGQEEAVEKVIRKNEIHYPIVMGSHDLARAYDVQGIPCLVLIAPDGTVQGRMVGFSEDGVNVLSRALDQLLAGQTLPSAQPLTEEEKKEAEEDRPRSITRDASVKWNRSVFDVVWSNRTRFAETSRRQDPVHVRIPRRHLVLLNGSNALVLRAGDGTLLHEVPLPEAARQADALERKPDYLFLENGAESVVLAIQMTYEIEGKGDAKTYRTVNTQISGYGLDGAPRWTQSLGEQRHLSTADVVPIGGRDHVVLADWDSFLVVDASGQSRVQQTIGYNSTVEITDTDADGYPEFTVQGSSVQGAVWKRSE